MNFAAPKLGLEALTRLAMWLIFTLYAPLPHSHPTYPSFFWHGMSTAHTHIHKYTEAVKRESSLFTASVIFLSFSRHTQTFLLPACAVSHTMCACFSGAAKSRTKNVPRHFSLPRVSRSPSNKDPGATEKRAINVAPRFIHYWKSKNVCIIMCIIILQAFKHLWVQTKMCILKAFKHLLDSNKNVYITSLQTLIYGFLIKHNESFLQN